ncbi:MAG TPA: glycosyltransferase, partial [Smithellaceae bacterium]|nr:glycosyltransferase [Smithellaceae bacterium]
MRKKLLIVSPEQFGYQSDHYYYCKYLKAHFDIDFICFDKAHPIIQEENVNVIYRNFNKDKIQRLLSFIWFAIKKTKEKDYDAFLTDYFKMVFFIGLFGKCKLKILDIKTGSLIDNLFIRWISNKIIWFSTLFFDKVSTLSANIAALLKLNSEKTFIVPLGAVVLDGTSKCFDKIHLVYIGTLHKRCIEQTIVGFSRFYSMYAGKVSLKYDIVGFSHIKDDEEKIKSAVSKNNLNEIVIFHGRKNHQQLKEYIQNATVGVCFVPQTPYYDVQPPTKIFEYALSGLITVATDTSENRRFITDVNGVICKDNADSFCEALE